VEEQVTALDEDNTAYKQANRELQRRLYDVLSSTDEGAGEHRDSTATGSTGAAVREQELRAFNTELQKELGNLRAFVHATSGTEPSPLLRNGSGSRAGLR
jgi:hypothetical protein